MFDSGGVEGVSGGDYDGFVCGGELVGEFIDGCGFICVIYVND